MSDDNGAVPVPADQSEALDLSKRLRFAISQNTVPYPSEIIAAADEIDRLSRKTLELQRVYDERGLQVIRLEGDAIRSRAALAGRAPDQITATYECSETELAWRVWANKSTTAGTPAIPPDIVNKPVAEGEFIVAENADGSYHKIYLNGLVVHVRVHPRHNPTASSACSHPASKITTPCS